MLFSNVTMEIVQYKTKGIKSNASRLWNDKQLYYRTRLHSITMYMEWSIKYP